jgi:hypothetical protein
VDAWDIAIGETLLRSELHRRWGGAPRGGMEPAPRASSVFLFSKPGADEAYGYKYDGWHADGTFHYTGDGQVGDQSEGTGGNKALLDAHELGRAVRLFQSDGASTTYAGEFALSDPPFYRADAPDRKRETRSVLVFRLAPVEAVAVATLPQGGKDTDTPEELPVEAFDVEAYVRSHPDEPPVAVRREALLVQDFVAHLGSLGHEAVRHRIPVPGGPYLFTDVFDKTADELIEAKASSARVYVRAALGQILDYSRFITHSSRALLLPVRPSPDLIELLHSYEVAAIWRQGKGFQRSRP